MIQEEQTDLFILSKEQAGIRLDKLLSLHFPHYSRTYFQSLIEKQSVLVNGKICKKRDILEEGDEIEVCFLFPEQSALIPENIPLDVLYEDEFLLAVNKPQGMVVHPAPGHPTHTFVHALLFYCQTIQGIDPIRPGIVHRLDKDTSGVLLAAKTCEAHRALVDLFATRQITKTYLALCIGTPKEGLIDAPIGRHPTLRQQMSVFTPRSKEAKTVVSKVTSLKELAFVEIDLLTGRTHQIRVHLKHIGHPILGDPVYGSLPMNKKWGVKTPFLHAYQLTFTHPFKKINIKIEAPLPASFLDYTHSSSNILASLR